MSVVLSVDLQWRGKKLLYFVVELQEDEAVNLSLENIKSFVSHVCCEVSLHPGVGEHFFTKRLIFDASNCTPINDSDNIEVLLDTIKVIVQEEKKVLRKTLVKKSEALEQDESRCPTVLLKQLGSDQWMKGMNFVYEEGMLDDLTDLASPFASSQNTPTNSGKHSRNSSSPVLSADLATVLPMESMERSSSGSTGSFNKRGMKPKTDKSKILKEQPITQFENWLLEDHISVTDVYQRFNPMANLSTTRKDVSNDGTSGGSDTTGETERFSTNANESTRYIQLHLLSRNLLPTPSIAAKILSALRVPDAYGVMVTEFSICVRQPQGGLEWMIRRRFSDFDMLHQALLSQDPKDSSAIRPNKLPALPSKHFGLKFISNSDSVVERRQVLLQQYLDDLMYMNKYKANYHIMQFLGLLNTSKSVPMAAVSADEATANSIDSKDSSNGNSVTTVTPAPLQIPKNVVHISKLLSAVRCGTIILFRCNNVMSSLQRKFTGGYWDHVGLVVSHRFHKKGAGMGAVMPEDLKILESTGRGVTVFPLLSRLNAYHNSNFCEEICFRNLTDNNATNNVVTVKMQLPTIVDDYFPSDETSGASGTSTPGIKSGSMSPNSGRGRSNSPKPQSGTPDPPRGGTVVTTSRNAPGPFLQHEVFLSAMCLFVNAVEGNKYAFHFSHLFPSITKRDQNVGDVGEEGDSSPGTFWSNFYSSMSDCFHPMTTLSKDSHEDDQLDDADEATKSISESKKDWEAAKAAKVALARRNSSSKTKISRRHRGEAVAAAKVDLTVRKSYRPSFSEIPPFEGGVNRSTVPGTAILDSGKEESAQDTAVGESNSMNPMLQQQQSAEQGANTEPGMTNGPDGDKNDDAKVEADQFDFDSLLSIGRKRNNNVIGRASELDNLPSYTEYMCSIIDNEDECNSDESSDSRFRCDSSAPKPRRMPRHLLNSSAYFCSELVAAALQAMKVLPNQLNPGFFWPDSFAPGKFVDKFIFSDYTYGEETIIDCRVLEVSKSVPVSGATPSYHTGNSNYHSGGADVNPGATFCPSIF